MSIYLRNMETLKSRDEYLYNKILTTNVNRDRYELIETRNGSFTVKAIFFDEMNKTELFLHSKYDPVKEAESFANTQFETKSHTNILYGFGLGYHVKKVLEKLDWDDVLYVVDLNLEIFKLAMEAVDITVVLSDRRLRFVISDDEKYIAGMLRGVLTEENKFCQYVPCIKAIPPQHEKFKFILEDWNIKKSLTDKWIDLMGQNYNDNRNVKCQSVGVLFNKYRNVPIIIVSSGPSLNKNKHLLSQLKGKALVFAVGSALKPLLEAGISPDMFCIIDPQPITYKQIEGCENLDIPLVFLDTASFYTVSKYNGPKYIACNEESRVENKEFLIDSGGSVATAVMDMAIKFGGNPIVFVGQDLAFTDNLHHAKGDMYGGSIEKKSLPNMRKVKGQNGEVLNTSLGLLSFKHWIENRIKDCRNIRFINATEGGALIEGCAHMSLEKFIEEASGRQGRISNGFRSFFFLEPACGDCDENTVFIFLGLNKVNEEKELTGLLESRNIVLIVEPDMKVYEEALKSGRLKGLLKSDNVRIITGNNPHGFIKALEECTGISNHNNFRVVRGYPGTTGYEAYYNQIESLVNIHIEQIKMQVNTIHVMEEKIRKNIFDNLPYIAKGSTIRVLKNTYAGIPGVIVSAGPSLEKNIEQLKEIVGKAVIIAGVRTLKPLLDRGIQPDFILNIDPNDIACKLSENYLNEQIPLITLFHGNNNVLKAHKENNVFIGDPFCNNALEYLSGNVYDGIEVGGSVANASLAAAYHMGCDPIVFVGQDLAYTEDKLHSDMASLRVDKNNVSEKKISLFSVKDIYGNMVKTDHSLLCFRRWFEKFISGHKDRVYLNATEGGVAIAGAENMPLRDVLDKYCISSKTGNPPGINMYEDNTRKEDFSAITERLNEMKARLYEMKLYVQNNLGFAYDLHEHYTGKAHKDINQILAGMDENDEFIKNRDVENAILHYYLQKSNLEIVTRYARKLNETGEESDLRIIERNIRIYEEKGIAIDRCIKDLEDCIKKFVESV